MNISPSKTKTKTKTATQKSKGVSRRSPEVQYLSLPTCRSQTCLRYQILFTAPSRFTDLELVVPQPINKNAIDRPGRTTPLERFFSQYPKFEFQPSESPISEFKRLCKAHEKDARQEFNIAVKKARNLRRPRSLCYVVPQPKIDIFCPIGGVAPLERFFVQYPEFRYDPSKPPVAEFNRLYKEYRQDARHEFDSVIKREFYNLYGTDEKDINNWHKLCRALRIDPIPDTLKKSRAVSCHLFVPSDFLTW